MHHLRNWAEHMLLLKTHSVELLLQLVGRRNVYNMFILALTRFKTIDTISAV